MKKMFLTLIVAAMFVACDDGSSPTAPASTPTYTTPTNTTPTYSSQATPKSSSSVPTSQYTTQETMYAAEIGKICTGFNFGAVNQAKATEGYLAMVEICGNRATQSTGTTCRTASAVTSWMKSLNISAFDQVNADIAAYGASFRWYNAEDGYKRYIYLEPCGDGKGLMKKQSN